MADNNATMKGPYYRLGEWTMDNGPPTASQKAYFGAFPMTWCRLKRVEAMNEHIESLRLYVHKDIADRISRVDHFATLAMRKIEALERTVEGLQKAVTWTSDEQPYNWKR